MSVPTRPRGPLAPSSQPAPTRRSVLGAAAALAALPLLARPAPAAEGPFTLTAAPAVARLRAGTGAPEVPVLAYNGRIPGPELRFRQGDTARIRFTNGLDAPTTVHWHGLRVPNAMDGVPHISHPPIQPGAGFDYEFALPDAGTFWYHPHADSARQLGRGLAGAFVVEEAEPPPVDRDLLWLLSDRRTGETGALKDDFGDPMDATHAGRLGALTTINGQVRESVAVRSGERLRLRLVNAANARIYALGFPGLAPLVIALDGQPVSPHAPEGGRLLLAPGQRADLILDIGGGPDARFPVTDSFPDRPAVPLTELVCAAGQPLRAAPPVGPVSLPANPLPSLDLASAVRQEVVLEGGMHGERAVDPMEQPGGPFWWLNGVAAMSHDVEPLLLARRGQTVVFSFVNRSEWWHPMHLHGFPFRVLSRGGLPVERVEWRDTELLPPHGRAEVAFVAAEAGAWMLHCHVLEHQETGMMAVLRVV